MAANESDGYGRDDVYHGGAKDPVDLEQLLDNVEQEVVDDEEDRVPFDPDRIDVQTKTPTVSLMLDRLRRQSLDLQPDFQRLSGLWTIRNQSRLIESLLLRIPLPSFYAAANSNEDWAIVDGVQRLTAIARFIEPDSLKSTPLRLSGLEYLKEFEGFAFNQLPGKLQTRLLESEIVLHLIREGTPDAVKFNIFARLNTGGLPLSYQEIRHALIPGESRQLLFRLANLPEFFSATDGSVNPRRMMDREMVLRFIAFYNTRVDDYQESDFDNFLRKAMQNINSLDLDEIEATENSFKEAMKSARIIFGDEAFRRRDSDNRRSPINKALFEAISVNLAKLSQNERRVLELEKAAVDKGLIKLLNQYSFTSAIQQGTSSPHNVRTRFNGIRDLFLRIIDQTQGQVRE